MDFYKQYWEFESFFRKLFSTSSTMSDLELETSYASLIASYPDYYTKTWNNQNFLFLKDFDYSKEFLAFFSKKVDLNFLEGNKGQSPLFFSLQEALHFTPNLRNANLYQSLNKKDAEKTMQDLVGDSGNLFFILKTDNPKIIKFKVDLLKNVFKNYHNFFDYPLSRACYKDEYSRSSLKSPPLHILSQIIEKISAELNSSYSKINKGNIDWEKTRVDVWNNIFLMNRFMKNDFYHSFNCSVNSHLTPVFNFVLMLVRLPWSEEINLKQKQSIYNDIKAYSGPGSIDWFHKIEGTPLAYKIMNILFDPTFSKGANSQEYYDFTKNIIFNEILASGFSFHTVFSTHHKVSSLYEMIEENWLKNQINSTSGNLEQKIILIKLMKDVLSEGPIFEEKLKLENQVLFKNSNNEIKKLKI